MNDSIKLAWSEEYKRKGIPSSFRLDPTKPLVEFISWLKQKGFTGNVAADIGCGLGRNSFYLASQGFSVTGIELLEENGEAVNLQAKTFGASVQVHAQDAATPWPMAPQSLDIAIDIFCYKHIVDKERQKKYRCELSKALKPNGFYFISLASENDGFYGPLIENRTEKRILDPYSGIASFLYSREDLVSEFSDFFKVVEIWEQCSTSPMYGKEYSRKVLNAIFQTQL